MAAIASDRLKGKQPLHPKTLCTVERIAGCWVVTASPTSSLPAEVVSLGDLGKSAHSTSTVPSHQVKSTSNVLPPQRISTTQDIDISSILRLQYLYIIIRYTC